MEHQDERLAEHTRLVQPQAESFERGELLPSEPEPYIKEPLFSKKVLIGWGLGTLIVWFTLSYVVPAVVQSVRQAIVTNIGKPQKTPEGETVFRTKRGIVTIRRTPTGIIIDRQEEGAPAAAPAPPQAPAPIPVPAPEATGKK